jgi:hypothetical protein
MRTLLSVVVFSALLAQVVYSAAGPLVTLVLPHPLQDGDAAWLELKLGIIPRGERIEISTPEGRFLGAISPYGIRAGREAGIYTVPLPPDTISDNHVSLRLSVTESGHEERAPTADEVKNISLKIVHPNR